MQIDDFISIEKKYDLYHLEVDGVQPWMYFRFVFWNYRICRDLLSLSNNLQTKGAIGRYVQQLKAVFSQIPHGSVRHIGKADIIFYAHPRRIRTGNYFECIYTDCLLDKYPQSIVMEDPFMNRHLTPIRAEHIYYTDRLHVKAALYSRIQKCLKTGRYQKIYEQIQNGFEKPLRELESAYQFAMPYEKIYMKLTELVLEVQILKKRLRKMLETVHPRLIVEVIYYDTGRMVLNELAKEKGIPTVELQHGTMHTAHAAYQFADGCGMISQFPDHVFLFSEYWKRCVHLPIDEARVKVTGYPYFERQLGKYNRKPDIKSENATNIIFVSQGTIGRELSRLAADLCDMLDERKYHIIYKLHPGEYDGWRERNAELLRDNIEVIDSLDHSIYEYFPQCRIQVGAYSTAIYEGLGFGLTTYIYDVGHADTMLELCRQGYAAYVRNAEELYTHITAGAMNDGNNGKEFWKMNALENICDEIDDLLRK